VAILIIEHVMRAIMSLSDLVVALNLGRNLAEGPPQQVANNPAVIEAYLGDPKLMTMSASGPMSAAEPS
jgi:branched-chain amino acid transport system ATP-binding protein